MGGVHANELLRTRSSVVCGARSASIRCGFRKQSGRAKATVGLLCEEGPPGRTEEKSPPPHNSSPAPRCPGGGPAAGRGAPGPTDPSAASAASSAPLVSGAGRGGEGPAPSQCAGAAPRLVEARPSPQPPRPRLFSPPPV